MTTALYRRYRPENFAEVIGQDHVTAPLGQALRSGQVNHAYLFSGPRGCGKTSSARILARILNCAENTEEHPTDTPCGVCESCVELARGGPGSLDVVEIDAASHGGVDDARELRERATFAPARDRYKVFILDEAHMVSPQGFNALLKIVEEPPPHIKFIFATTEPDKVIGTIRSRTHHYPFRLVPPDVLVPYLQQLCDAEHVQVGSGVLPLVTRAGGGSVRDTLSVLDQLIAGSGGAELGYEGAADLLGYTRASLLDDVVEAVAARDGAAAFRVVDRVIATGHEPRRFVEDVLERLRDLIVIAASGDDAAAALRDVPSDQMVRMRLQAGHLGPSELSRSADLANAALTEMTGATSPRLHLELLMARLLLPAADDTRTGLGARLDRLERGLPSTGAGVRVPVTDPEPTPPAAARPAVARPAVGRPAAETDAGGEVVTVVGPDAVGAGRDAESAASSTTLPTSTAAPAPAAPAPAPAAPAPAAPAPSAPAPAAPAPAAPPAPAPTPAAPASAPASARASAPATVGHETEVVRRRWPEVLETVKGLRRVTWALIDPSNAQVADLDATTLRIAFENPALATTFRNGAHADVVARAVRETLGFDVRVEAVLAEHAGAPATPPARAPAADRSNPRAVSPAEAAASWDDEPPEPLASEPHHDAGARDAAPRDAAPHHEPGEPPHHEPDGPPRHDPGGPARHDPGEPAQHAPDEPPHHDPGEPAHVPEPPADLDTSGPSTHRGSARERGIAAARASAARVVPGIPDDPSPDDPEISESSLSGAPLIAQMLGGTVIDEQLDDGPA